VVTSIATVTLARPCIDAQRPAAARRLNGKYTGMPNHQVTHVTAIAY
jgi:hypothetical protein